MDSHIDLVRVFDKLHLQYDAICVFSISSDSIYQLKFPIPDHDVLASSQHLRWSEALIPVVRDLVSPEYQDAVRDFLQPQAMQAALTGPQDQAEIAFRSQNDHWKRLIIQPLSFLDGKVNEILYLLTDQTQQINRFEELRSLSEHDALTGLYNRTKLNQMIKNVYATMPSCGVLFFDVNNLKATNDTFSHEAGDRLICQVARNLHALSGSRIHAYRYGGDEFILIAVGYTHTQLDALAIRWQEHLAALNQQSDMTVSVAVGRAWAQAPFDVRSLIACADKDMYENKRRSKQR